jgi:hypothetical protein
MLQLQSDQLGGALRHEILETTMERAYNRVRSLFYTGGFRFAAVAE